MDASLATLPASAAQPSARPTDPPRPVTPSTGVHGSASLVVHSDLPVLAGHFPQHPILPGVMLLALARQAAGQALGRPVHLRTVIRQRFMRPVLPGTCVTVDVDVSAPTPEGYRLACRWKLDDGSVVSRAELVVV